MPKLFSVIGFVIITSCFSAKGLPIKQADETPQETSEIVQTKDHQDDSHSTNEEQEPIYNSGDKDQDSIVETSSVDHSAWDALLKKYVADNGDVDYKGFKKGMLLLNDYVNYLAIQVPSESWSSNEQLAYFINVYNANTIKLIVDNYPTKSIKDITNPWLKNRIKIGDKDFSLADIENGILRKMNEPRIHFAINCASFSCPKLVNTAYTATNVQELMELATREFINNPSKNKLGKEEVTVSEIFKWYKNDFTEGGSVIGYINQYSDIQINPNAKIDYMEYDWRLNEQN